MGAHYANDPAHGDEYYTPRRPGDDDPLLVSVVKIVFMLAAVPFVLLWRHPVATPVIVLGGWLLLFHGVAFTIVSLAVIAGLVAWYWRAPDSFERFVVHPARGRWRRWRTYGRGWSSAMHMCGLAKGWGAKQYAPHVITVRRDPHVDHVRVKLLPGQTSGDFAASADALAATFGALSCRVEQEKPGVVWLRFVHADALHEPVPPLEPDDPVALDALTLGTTDTGTPWQLALPGTHVLVAGATNSGKGSVIWSTICALAPAVRDGWVQVWAVDPKGGIELAPGAGMFARFAHEPEPMVQLVEQAAELIRTRADAMRGNTRQHTPTTADPFVVLIIDELAFLTAYMPDRALTKRLASALSVVLSQGRAAGLCVLAAVQDPRKEIVNMRDLFPTRIALRMTEADQVDMVLGDGTHHRGAHCERIPEHSPGVGYVAVDGRAEPVRVRAAYLADEDITTLCHRFAPHRSTTRASSGPVVRAISTEAEAA
ncbi:FtsK/SpoIIIE domain-containing protein [Phytoactinopolyspora limicola]|uniref:FtsK/SpoIIIE domain-containing protein n=1 Tax=Phytoactinopolyspora limicola TaxID=2715536 RepID=UPI00140BBCF8|nr:FtsK/SpoIIIE domain-containing protein [Phytoactinopolyspora limicola]